MPFTSAEKLSSSLGSDIEVTEVLDEGGQKTVYIGQYDGKENSCQINAH